jgi:hypothetical protein
VIFQFCGYWRLTALPHEIPACSETMHRALEKRYGTIELRKRWGILRYFCISSEKRLLDSSCLPVCLSPFISAALAERIFMKFGMGNFTKICQTPDLVQIGQQNKALDMKPKYIYVVYGNMNYFTPQQCKGTQFAFPWQHPNILYF